MRFYTQQHKHYCGIDLHARSPYLCILNQAGEKLVHRKLSCDRDELLKALKPYREDLVVAVESLFCWYWLADLCQAHGIAFVLGHALYMKAIHQLIERGRNALVFTDTRGFIGHTPRAEAIGGDPAGIDM